MLLPCISVARMLRMFAAYESRQVDSELCGGKTMGKWQSEEEINAELRKLAREVRALRTNLRRKTSTSGWPGRRQSADDRQVRETPQPADDCPAREMPEPADEERQRGVSGNRKVAPRDSSNRESNKR